jgi:aldehyde dehydrogenase (NAD+)
VVVLPSEPEPGPAVELYRILDYSDVPGGVFNLLTGLHAEMAPTLAGHDDVDAIWHFGDPEGAKEAERLSIGNLKQTWTATRSIEWETFVGPEILRRSTQVKNVWVPVGE